MLWAMLRKDAAVLLYSPAVDPFLEDLMKNADRVFYFDEGPRAVPRMVANGRRGASKDATGRNNARGILVNWPDIQWTQRREARRGSLRHLRTGICWSCSPPRSARARTKDSENIILIRLAERTLE